MPWSALSYLIPKTRVKIITLNELFDFGIQEMPRMKSKLKRFKKRYLSGEKGEVLLEYMCQQDIVDDYLECYHPERQKTDRNEFIKLFSSLYNKAYASKRVENLNFINLVKGLKKTRGKPKAPPELKTYITILQKAFDMGHHELSLNLLLQESVFMRKSLTTTQAVDCISFDDLRTEIGAESHKNGKLGSYLHTPQLKVLTETYLDYLRQASYITKTRNGEARFLFESPIKKGQARNNFDGQFNKVREAVIKDIEKRSYSDALVAKQIKAVKEFTQHRIRSLNEALILEVGSTEAQKENAFNRSVNEVSSAYGDLSDEKQRELKVKKFNYILTKHPEYKGVIDGLIANWKKAC